MSAQPTTEPRLRDTWRDLARWIEAQFAGTWRDLPVGKDPVLGERVPPQGVLYPKLIAAQASQQLADLSSRYGVTEWTAGWRVVVTLRWDDRMLDVCAEAPTGRQFSIIDLANGRGST